MILVRSILSCKHLNHMNNVKPPRLLRNTIIAWIVISFLLLLNRQYGVYSLGKWLIFGIDIYALFYIYKSEIEKRDMWLSVLIVMMIIFNPIFPIPFRKATRQVFDILSWIILIIIYIILNKDQRIIFRIKNIFKKTKIIS